ncbi:MAG TPA: hypothetical protein VF952_14270 [Chloroflexia bacterium]|jgi:hypothetical protein
MLSRLDDDRVEALRTVARLNNPEGLAARAEIARLLESAVREEWALLAGARDAFWDLDLEVSPGVDNLAAISFDRLMFTSRGRWSPPSSVHALAKLYGEHEYLSTLVEALDFRYDQRVRELARTTGQVIRARVLALEPPAERGGNWRLLLQTLQERTHVRLGASLQTVDWSVQGRVVTFEGDMRSEAIMFQLSITGGIRKVRTIQVGTVLDWTDAVVFNNLMLNSMIYKELGTLRPWLAYGKDP